MPCDTQKRRADRCIQSGVPANLGSRSINIDALSSRSALPAEGGASPSEAAGNTDPQLAQAAATAAAAMQLEEYLDNLSVAPSSAGSAPSQHAGTAAPSMPDTAFGGRDDVTVMSSVASTSSNILIHASGSSNRFRAPPPPAQNVPETSETLPGSKALAAAPHSDSSGRRNPTEAAASAEADTSPPMQVSSMGMEDTPAPATAATDTPAPAIAAAESQLDSYLDNLSIAPSNKLGLASVEVGSLFAPTEAGSVVEDVGDAERGDVSSVAASSVEDVTGKQSADSSTSLDFESMSNASLVGSASGSTITLRSVALQDGGHSSNAARATPPPPRADTSVASPAKPSMLLDDEVDLIIKLKLLMTSVGAVGM